MTSARFIILNIRVAILFIAANINREDNDNA